MKNLTILLQNKDDIKVGDNLIDKIGDNYHIVTEYNMELDEWEKSFHHFLVLLGSFDGLNVYSDVPYGDCIITERTFDLKIVAFTITNYCDMLRSTTELYFTHNNREYYFDQQKGLYSQCLNFNYDE